MPEIKSAEDKLSIGYAVRLAVTDDNGSDLDMGFLIDLSSSQIVVLFPHERPGLFDVLAPNDFLVFFPDG